MLKYQTPLVGMLWNLWSMAYKNIHFSNWLNINNATVIY